MLAKLHRAAAVGGTALILWSSAGTLAPLAAQEATWSPSVELTRPVEEALVGIQEAWLAWLEAYDRGRPDDARLALDDLLSGAGELGMRWLPDLGRAASAAAVAAARRGQVERSRWALEAAEILDPGRPESAFAAARAARARGAYLRAGERLLAGLGRLWAIPHLRAVWVRDLVLWGLFVLLVTGGAFVIVQTAVKLPTLVRGLADRLEEGMSRRPALLVAVLLLLWPLALPRGPLWVLLYWSVLLWIVSSGRERTVLASLWLLLAVTPGLMAAQRQRLDLALSPPVRAMEELAARRLSGSLPTDLGLLAVHLPESVAARELLGDLHRRLGQWDLARNFYDSVLQEEPENLASLLNLGAYHLRTGEVVSAIRYFGRATLAAPESAEAFFNLSQAQSLAYLFEQSAISLRRARELNAAAVGRWIGRLAEQRVVTLDGGIQRRDEIAAELEQRWRGGEDERAWLGSALLSPTLFLMLLFGLGVIAWHLLRRLRGVSRPVKVTVEAPPWWEVMPGLGPATRGEGLRSFTGLLVPVAAISLPLLGRVGYPVPWGLEPGTGLLWVLAAVILVPYAVTRLRAAAGVGA